MKDCWLMGRKESNQTNHSKRQRQCTMLRLRPAAYIHLSTIGKRRFLMTSSLRQHITGYTVANS